jgi:hypothetical protein
MPHQYATWAEKDDHFYFGYTPHRQPDGKFHACKWKSGGLLVKDIAFGKRHVARARALKWYHKRVEALDKMAENKKSRVKPRPQLTPVERRAVQVEKNLMNAAKRKKELVRIAQQSRRRIAAAKTRYDKWAKKEKRWLKELNELERQKGKNVRIESMVDTFG